MKPGERFKQIMARPDRVSYALMAVLFVMMVWLHLTNLLLAVLFSFLALNLLHWRGRNARWFAIAFFLVLVSAVGFILTTFIAHTLHTLPEIAEKAIPSVLHWAKDYRVDLPFTDYDSLREFALATVKHQLRNVASFARFAREAGLQALFLVAGIVVSISIFLNSRFELGREPQVPENNFYSVVGQQLAVRFRTLYESFATVMGAQIIISAINTVFTGIFVVAVGLPYAPLVVGVTFLCGLLPVIGNLISNTIIVGIGFTVSPQMAFFALAFLVAIHKLEYFLNSKIIGQRIRNPLWLTLLGLIVGEKLMGIPGIIIAPVLLNYIKLEASKLVAAPAPLEEVSAADNVP